MMSPAENQGLQTTPSAAPSQGVQSFPDAPAHGELHGHEHVPAPTGPLFPEKEWEEMHVDDVHAGGAIVCLMAGIFTIGLMLYTTIALIVAS